MPSSSKKEKKINKKCSAPEFIYVLYICVYIYVCKSTLIWFVKQTFVFHKNVYISRLKSSGKHKRIAFDSYAIHMKCTSEILVLIGN